MPCLDCQARAALLAHAAQGQAPVRTMMRLVMSRDFWLGAVKLAAGQVYETDEETARQLLRLNAAQRKDDQA